MAVTFAAILDGIATTLSTATGIKTTMSYDQLTEGIPGTDLPRLQVYPESLGGDPNSRTDRSAFNAAMQLQEFVVFVDVFASKRQHIAQDMTAVVDTLDNLVNVLQAEEKPPFFGVSGIKSFSWAWKRAVLRYGTITYMGGRFTILTRIA